MSVHVTQEQPTLTITSVPVIITFNDATKIEALCVSAWELNLTDNRVYKVDSHYETTKNVWIDETLILNVSFFSDSSVTTGDIQWFSFEGQFYYWQDNSFYYADGNAYIGDTTNWEIVGDTTINNTTVSESWQFSLAWEYTEANTFAPITKCTRISNTGTLVIRYFRGSVEIFPVLVEDVLPASAYGTKSILLKSGERFDSRSFLGILAGISISLIQTRQHYSRDGVLVPASSVAFTWFTGTSVREVVTETRSKVINWNAEGGQESLNKDFLIEVKNGAEVDIHIRTLDYPIVSASEAVSVNADIEALAAVTSTYAT